MKKLVFVVLATLMLAVSVNAAFEKVNTYDNNFSDVKDSAWYAENVKTAYELGFMNGKSEGKFDPNGNVTVVEALTMASRLHAIYNGTEVKPREAGNNEFRIDFDSMENVSVRSNTIGRVEDGVLVLESKGPNNNGLYDLGTMIVGLDLDANEYNKVKIRMRRDFLPNVNGDENRDERLELFYITSTETQYDMSKYVAIGTSKVSDMSEWFEVEVDVSSKEKWKDYIKGVRLDPTNNNGIYYIDYISFTRTEKQVDNKWYQMYVDYAVDNKIVNKDKFREADYTRNITRFELCELFAAALPEECYAPINEVKGIPDVFRDEENADIVLMLYKAGILLGSDSKGTFNPASDIKRSEVAAIINRAALPENRVNGSVDFDWAAQGNEYDLEFTDESSLDNVTFNAESVEVKNGSLVLVPKYRGDGQSLKYDPQIIVKDININADEYTKLKVRMKVDFDDEISNTNFEFFYMTDDDENFSQSKFAFADLLAYAKVDPAGWFVVEVDLALREQWKGTVKAFRFDPANTGGTYTIDYIRLAKADYLQGASHDALVAEGYTSNRLFEDEDMANGFYVSQVEMKQTAKNYGMFTDYCETAAAPLWAIAPIWSKYDLVENRDTKADKYTLADTYGINTVKYNPEEKSLSLRLDATKVYYGEAHDSATYNWWPHLLIEQLEEVDKKKNSAAADRVFAEVDLKLSDFKTTTNPEGINACQYVANFYLMTDKAPGQRIWFGLSLFDDRLGGNTTVIPSWSPDSAANMYMYIIPTAVVFDGIENSFTPKKGEVVSGDEWKHVRLDITPHIDRAVEWANRDNIFGTQITKEDLYFGGVNIGFEIHGNYDATFEHKNLNIVSYYKD